VPHSTQYSTQRPRQTLRDRSPQNRSSQPAEWPVDPVAKRIAGMGIQKSCLRVSRREVCGGAGGQSIQQPSADYRLWPVRVQKFRGEIRVLRPVRVGNAAVWNLSACSQTSLCRLYNPPAACEIGVCDELHLPCPGYQPCAFREFHVCCCAFCT
jgi:hypothetical protein